MLAGWDWLLGGYLSRRLPVFCLERWQSLHETRVEVLLSESGVEPPGWEELSEMLGVEPLRLLEGVDLGYGWTRGSPGLREKIASSAYRGLVGPDNIVATVGSAEANLAALLALVEPGDTVVVDMPSYMQVRLLAEALGARVVEAWRSPVEAWRLPVERLVELIEELGPRLVYLNNPSNPTGAVAGRGELLAIAEAAARRGTVLVVDEVYRGLEPWSGEATPTVLEAAVETGAAAVSVGGLSKAYGLPGLRIGWAAASGEELASRIWAARDYTTISPPRLSEALAEAVLEPSVSEGLLERARRIVRRNYGLLREALRPLGLEPPRPGGGAYSFIQLPHGLAGTRAAEHLLERHSALVVPGECFRVPGYIRVGLGAASEEEARRAYAVLARGLAELLGGGG